MVMSHITSGTASFVPLCTMCMFGVNVKKLCPKCGCCKHICHGHNCESLRHSKPHSDNYVEIKQDAKYVL